MIKPYINLYKQFEEYWFNQIPQKIRFVLTGAFNSLVSYAIFAVLYLTFRHYGIAVTLQWAITINLSILTMRYYVFQVKGNFKKDYIRGWEVYIFMYLFNFLSLFILVDLVKLHALVAQAFYMPVGAITTYLLHKYFAFRRTKV